MAGCKRSWRRWKCRACIDEVVDGCIVVVLWRDIFVSSHVATRDVIITEALVGMLQCTQCKRKMVRI